MPCLIVTGHPAAGKTTVAKLLKERALQHDAVDEVILLNEESECGNDVAKQSLYATSLAEKESRGTLKSAFDRAVGATTLTPQQRKRRLIILDSLNYIKGYRYELHCISKAAGETHGVLWVLNKPEVVKEWNSKRGDQGYSPELLQELILRYEPPDERNRWDKPLFTVDVASQNTSKSSGRDHKETTDQSTAQSEVLKQSVYNMHALGDVLGSNAPSDAAAETSDTMQQQQPSKPTKSAFKRSTKKSAFQRKAAPKVKAQHAFTPDDLKALEETNGTATPSAETAPQPTSAAKMLDSTLLEPTPATLEHQLDRILDVFLLKTKALKEGISTRSHVAGQANVLQNLDWISAQLISTIANVSSQDNLNANLSVTFHGSDQKDTTLPMKCQRPVALPELRRLRKMYLQWVANHPPADASEVGIAKSFVAYIEEHLR